MHACTYACTYAVCGDTCIFPKSLGVGPIYFLLFRARKELGFSAGVWFSFVITGREREEEEEERKGSSKARPIHLPLLFQRQQLELICDAFFCLTETSREPQCLCRKEQDKKGDRPLVGFNSEQKVNLKTRPLPLLYNLRFGIHN